MTGPLASLALIFALATAGPALAEEPPAVDGELHVTMKNAEYVKVQINGEDYDNTEFEKDGKVVLIKGLSLSLEHNNVTLLPTDTSLKPLELQVVPKDFKKKRKGKVFFLVATKMVTFEKAPAEPAPAPDAPPKTDPIAPPPPEKDL